MKESQIIYKKIVEKFINTKRKANEQNINESLCFFVEQIRKILELEKYEYFSPFCKDEEMIFETKRNIYSLNNPDTTLISNGLLYEFLDMKGVKNAQKISEDIADIIFDIYAKFSQDKKTADKEISLLKEKLDEIELIAS